MFTVSRPRPLLLQRVAFHLVRRLGTRVLLDAKTTWYPPYTAQEWGELNDQWLSSLGRFGAMALYQRRQLNRDGLTLMLTRDSKPLAVVKVRESPSGLDAEQAALAAIDAYRPQSFRAPRPLGSGNVGMLYWSAQDAVFTRPHQPVFDAPTGVYADIAAALAGVFPVDAARVPAHNDLTPWNLRRDSAGRVWLFDWEDCGSALPDSDRAYFCASSNALAGRPMPDDLSADVLEHWRRVVADREADNPADAALDAAQMRALQPSS